MAKTLGINLDHLYESLRGPSLTVREALDWASANTGDDEGQGAKTAEDLVCYAVLRLMALAKDGARYASGKAPECVYASRVTGVDGAAKNADAVRDAAKEILAKAMHMSVKAPVARPASKLAANEKRIAEIEAKLAAKVPAPAVKAAPLVVRKASVSTPKARGKVA